ncbi:hypothetical protein SteCoe_34404 [Stentor coeruleus]|uniref:Uncharacterized protein n=1 Tax=Stentor coeruleus TaxID=5963 RepID=A0A1R2AUL3_9CILI|nr:hypothetical protein SteCoe_34404 [Stentor coeruleus]
MNEYNSDRELRFILQEARENYQKRIANLKTSMQSIYNDIPTEPDKIDKKPFSNRRGSAGEKEISNFLNKNKGLTSNEISKSVSYLEPIPTKTKVHNTHHSRRESTDSTSEHYLLTAEINRLNEFLKLSERENKELKLMIETLKFENKAFEENSMKSRKKISEFNEENIVLGKKIRDLEEYVEKCKYEIESCRKENRENKQNAYKLQTVENERNMLEREIIKYKGLITGPSYESIRTHYKSKNRKLKNLLEEKNNDMTKLKNNVEELEKELRTSYGIEKQAICEEFEHKANSLKNKNASIRSENKKLQSELQDQREKISEFIEKIRELERIRDEKFRVDDNNIEMNKKIIELSEKITQLNISNTSLSGEISELNAKIHEMCLDNTKLLQENTILKDKVGEIGQSSMEIAKIHAENEIKLKNIETNYEGKLNFIKNDLSQRAEKEISRLMIELETIESEYKKKINDKTLTISELENKNFNLQKIYNEQLTSHKDLKQKHELLQQDYFQASKSNKSIISISEEHYQKELSQQKNTILILESEIQKLCDQNGKLSSENETFKEKCKNLKNSHSEMQQKLLLNSNIFEKQMEEFKKNYLLQEKEIEYYRAKESEYESYTPRVEKLVSDLRTSEEIKNELKSSVIRMRDELKADKAKISNLRDMVKVGLKQLKGEFFQNIKSIHRMAFEELTTYKKTLIEASNLLTNKISFDIKSMQLAVNLQKTHQKKYEDNLFKEAEDACATKEKFSQLTREITIRDDRISYLENSLKACMNRNKNNEQDILKGLVNQVSNLEDGYMENCKQIVDMVIQLKALQQKEIMDNNKDNYEKIQEKNRLLELARTEIERIDSDKNFEVQRSRQEISILEQKLLQALRSQKGSLNF